MSTEYIFTQTHANVFCRFIKYNHEQMIKEALDQPVQNARYFSFHFENSKCNLMYESNRQSSDQIDSVRMKIKFCDPSFTHLLYEFYIWKRDEEISLDWILEQIQSRVGMNLRICVCGEPITNPTVEQCEECYVFDIGHDEPCCICLEYDGRWVKLICDCKNGRMIHRHCFTQLLAQYHEQSGWKRKCPVCRKRVSMQKAEDLIEDPDFSINQPQTIN